MFSDNYEIQMNTHLIDAAETSYRGCVRAETCKGSGTPVGSEDPTGMVLVVPSLWQTQAFRNNFTSFFTVVHIMPISEQPLEENIEGICPICL